MENYINEFFEKELIELRRRLHACAEVGFDLPKTKEIVKSELENLGLEVKNCNKGCLYTVIKGKNPGKTLLLRADMDALPITEETNLDFASKNSNMHACGHDMHTAMLIGCAKILCAAKDTFCGSVKLMFQSAEELLLGCADAINGKILEDPKPDLAAFLHVITATKLKTGTAIVSGGGVCAPAAAFFEIEVLGKSAHASQVNDAVDALSTGARIVGAIDSISARELVGSSGAIVTIGQMSAGRCANVICDRCTVKGTVRSYDDNTVEFIIKRISDIARNTAKAHRASASTHITGSAPTLLSDRELSLAVFNAISKHLGSDNVIDGEMFARKSAANGKKISQGSEDFALISHKIPSVMIGLCAGNSDEGYEYPLHSPRTVFDERALLYGAKCYACAALEILKIDP